MRRVVIIGTGNVAWSLAQAIDALEDYSVVEVYSRSIKRAEALSSQLSYAKAVDSISDITKEADIYIVSIKDGAISELVSQLGQHEGIWLHTSGGVEADIFAPMSRSYGVFYPMQTFTHGKTLSFDEIPLFIEASDDTTLSEINNLANSLSSTVREADSNRRKQIHAAAVFACNFTNYLWSISDRLLQEIDSDFKMLKPLVEETFLKALEVGPLRGQTGPARRGDVEVMNGHIRLLNDKDSELYKILSERIFSQYKD